MYTMIFLILVNCRKLAENESSCQVNNVFHALNISRLSSKMIKRKIDLLIFLLENDKNIRVY